MNIYCKQYGEDSSNPYNRPKWSDIPEAPLDIEPPVDPNDLKIRELEKVPTVIVDEQKEKVEIIWN